MSSFDSKFDYLKLPLTDILTATNHFADENIVRFDGFGNEYKGQLLLSSGQLIDILARRLDLMFRRRTKEFQTEIMMLASLKHPNLVSIVGFCDEDKEKIIINKYEAKGSLDQYLSDPVTLTWTQRLQICLGIARALSYIHYDKQRSFSVIHRDIRSYKILLDDKWEAKLSGFELTTTQPSTRRHGLVLDALCGTRGYIDPAYVRSGGVSHKSDVYSFGMVLFEVLTGRCVYDSDNGDWTFLSKLVKSHCEKGTLNDIIHPGLLNQMDSQALNVFSEVAYCCLNDQRAQRPSIERVIFALEQALKHQLSRVTSERQVEGISTNYWKETHKDSLRISFEDIRLATQNFNTKIGRGRHGNVYQGEVLGVNGPTPIAVKQYEENDDYDEDGEREFLTELEILFEYKHENIIGLIGYCNEDNKKFLVFEQAPYGGLNFHVDNDSLTWTERLKIGIDVAIGLDFLHGGDSPVIHRGINSNNILLNDDWKAKITDFGVSLIASINDEIDFVVDHAYGTPGYFDPKYRNDGFLTRESDIYSLGVVLCEMMCGRTAYSHINKDNLADLVKRHYEEGKVDELVFKGIKDQIVPKSMVAFLKIAYECLYDEREKRPKASEVVLQLKKALEFQEDIEIWEAKLPKDYKEIIHMSKNPKIYSNLSNKDLCEKFSKGILLQNGKTVTNSYSQWRIQDFFLMGSLFFDGQIFTTKH